MTLKLTNMKKGWPLRKQNTTFYEYSKPLWKKSLVKASRVYTKLYIKNMHIKLSVGLFLRK